MIRPQLRALIALVLEQRAAYAAGSVFVAVGLASALAFPVFVKQLIDDGVMGGQARRIDELAIVLLVLLVAEGVATVVRDYYFNLAAERVTARLRQAAFDHLLRQEIAYFDGHRTGELTARLWGDVPAIHRIVGDRLGDGVRFALLAVFGTALLVYISPTLTLLVMLAIPPLAAAAWLLGQRVNTLSAQAQQAYAESGAAADESLAGIRTVRAFSQEPAERVRFARKIQGAVELARRKILANSAQSGVSLTIAEGAALLGLWAGGNLILQGKLTPGALLSFVLYGFLVARGLRNASAFWGEAVRGLGATRWIFDLLERRPRMPVDGGARPARVEGDLVLEGVCFTYPTRPDVEVLAGIDLRIAPGEVVALVGPSGAGKSTLLSLLLRFYDPDKGRILLDGVNLKDLDPSWLRGQLGVVMQEPVLFSGSIADNVRYGLDGSTDAEVRVAAERAGAREFIERLPDGFATAIGQRGVQLSGGQRQRLAIARAIVRRPAILVLDEATNALDPESESVVHRALRALDYRPTTLIIAHRLSTVIGVDRVVVLEGGRIVGTGRHDELLKSSTFYRRLVETRLAPV